jgi:hypothetical protein
LGSHRSGHRGAPCVVTRCRCTSTKLAMA